MVVAVLSYLEHKPRWCSAMPNHFTSIDAYGSCYQHVYILKIDMSMYVCMCICMCVCACRACWCLARKLVLVWSLSMTAEALAYSTSLLLCTFAQEQLLVHVCMYGCMYVCIYVCKIVNFKPTFVFLWILGLHGKNQSSNYPTLFRSIFLVTYMSIVS